MTAPEYITAQLLNLSPVPIDKAGQIRIKIHSELGKTNWLNISKEQLTKIEAILCEEAENAN